MGLFGTNGVRGKLDELSPQLAFDLSAAFATHSQGTSIAIGRDMRMTGPMLHAACVSGILSAGKQAVDLGMVSSPVAEWAHAKERTGGLIIVTASHNPAEWNALKFVDHQGVAISRERGEAIEKMAIARKYRQAGWKTAGAIKIDGTASARHASAVVSGVDAAKIRKRKLRVALDFGNGTSALSRQVFESLGCDIIPLNEKIDGNFPGRPSEPSEQNVQGLLKAVRSQSADFGVAWDGDSDRVVFADEGGNWMVGDRCFAISALEACREKRAQREKFIVTTVATSRAVEEACAALGAKTVYTKVGAPYLSEKMQQLGAAAVSGGEEVGGIIWPDFSLAKDGIFAAAKLCGMLTDSKLSELAAELPVYYNAKAKPQVAQKQKNLSLNAAKSHAQQSGGKVTLIDGVRVDFEDGWAIVRASGTENAMRIFAEASTRKRADSLMNEFKEIVEQAVG